MVYFFSNHEYTVTYYLVLIMLTLSGIKTQQSTKYKELLNNYNKNRYVTSSINILLHKLYTSTFAILNMAVRVGIVMFDYLDRGIFCCSGHIYIYIR